MRPTPIPDDPFRRKPGSRKRRATTRTDFRNSLRGLDLEALKAKLAALTQIKTQDLPGGTRDPSLPLDWGRYRPGPNGVPPPPPDDLPLKGDPGYVHPDAASRQPPPDFRKDVLSRRIALGKDPGFRKAHADLISQIRSEKDPAILAALKAKRDAKLFGRSQGTFTPDAPDEPLRGTVSPNFTPPKSWGGKVTPSMTKARRDEFLANRRRRRTGTSPGNRGRRRDFGIGVSSR